MSAASLSASAAWALGAMIGAIIAWKVMRSWGERADKGETSLLDGMTWVLGGTAALYAPAELAVKGLKGEQHAFLVQQIICISLGAASTYLLLAVVLWAVTVAAVRSERRDAQRTAATKRESGPDGTPGGQ